MARKIEVGLELEGEDAIEFLENLKNPKVTPLGMEVLKRAYELYRERAKNSR